MSKIAFRASGMLPYILKLTLASAILLKHIVTKEGILRSDSLQEMEDPFLVIHINFVKWFETNDIPIIKSFQ